MDAAAAAANDNENRAGKTRRTLSIIDYTVQGGRDQYSPPSTDGQRIMGVY